MKIKAIHAYPNISQRVTSDPRQAPQAQNDVGQSSGCNYVPTQVLVLVHFLCVDASLLSIPCRHPVARRRASFKMVDLSLNLNQEKLLDVDIEKDGALGGKERLFESRFEDLRHKYRGI